MIINALQLTKYFINISNIAIQLNYICIMISTTQCGNKSIRHLISPHFTMFEGRSYTIVETSLHRNSATHTVKNQEGEYRTFDHEELMNLIQENP